MAQSGSDAATRNRRRGRRAAPAGRGTREAGRRRAAGAENGDDRVSTTGSNALIACCAVTSRRPTFRSSTGTGSRRGGWQWSPGGPTRCCCATSITRVRTAGRTGSRRQRLMDRAAEAAPAPRAAHQPNRRGNVGQKKAGGPGREGGTGPPVGGPTKSLDSQSAWLLYVNITGYASAERRRHQPNP